MKRVLCYGDSNTWGYISGTDHQRYGENERWTRLLQKILGDEFEIIEEGLNSRTLFTEDTRPGKDGRKGYDYLKPCMLSHDKIDIVILMLGTNELKDSFENSAIEIVSMLDKFVDFILNFKSQIDGSSPKLILCGVPPISECAGEESCGKYKNAVGKCRELIKLCDKYFEYKNLIYVKNDDLNVGIDSVHLTKESHSVLSQKLAMVIKDNF